ncbi:SDR family oxidoreductase [Herbiconiux sp. CPCC 203407]|uniref:SDR family oxidoreductase n=1 Tax=Herbiconiux oxytropis TaxID=2970915 RepID=A0AA41XAG1_9MICO|nr:SDR family oxidoreductase [Herbiconiux oxytropis]MCS5721567.1 SDR family oxidoreductase [Herbiconiux oxytropis]MCS5724644.1 SDR family oxidoreductase [Herbiconiux oxytropis]
MRPPLAVVSGGASGIGRDFGRHWIERGGKVAVLDLRQAAVDEAVAFLGADASGHVVDVRDVDGVTAAVDRAAHGSDGRIDAVVNCAGIARPAPSSQVSDDEWMTMIDIHLNGTMRVCRAAYPHLLASDRASIVNVSSVAAAVGMPGRASYGAAKAGIEGLTRTLAVEWAGQGIRVNAVAPGYVRSAMTDGLVASGQLDLDPIVVRTPMRRFADAREITECLAFLASPAASFVTGQILCADGGLTVDGDWYP